MKYEATYVKRRFFVYVLAILFSIKLTAQHYEGSITYGQSSLTYQIDLIDEGEKSYVFFSSVDMNAYKIPCANTSLKNDTLQFYLVSDFFIYFYQYVRSSDTFNGKLRVFDKSTEELLNVFDTQIIPVEGNQTVKVVKTNHSFTSGGLKLSGSMWRPEKSNDRGILFVTSSQGNDRNGTNAEASYFARRGYTIFHYDKRGTGQSGGNWEVATIEELCADDLAAIHFFSSISALPLSEIGVKGSSQGGIKIPYILAKLPELGFGIAVSCPSTSLLESDLNHWKNRNVGKISQEDLVEAEILQRMAYDFVAGNIPYDQLKRAAEQNNDQSWMQFVWIPPSDYRKDPKLSFSGLAFYKELQQPVLVIQGLADEIIPLNSYESIRQSLAHSKSKQFKVITLENTSHSMNYINEEFPFFQSLSPKYLTGITSWLNEIGM